VFLRTQIRLGDSPLSAFYSARPGLSVFSQRPHTYYEKPRPTDREKITGSRQMVAPPAHPEQPFQPEVEIRTIWRHPAVKSLGNDLETAGDYPNFAKSSEQWGTVPRR
jgi:hypothetical protein